MNTEQETLTFSPQPGMRERQLQRRHGNPLFGKPVVVTGAQLGKAQREDTAEREQFYLDFQKTLEGIAAFSGNVDSEKVLAVKQNVDAQYEQCSGLCGDNAKALEGLVRLQEMMMQAIRAGAGDDPTAQAELEQEAVARHTHQQLLRFPIVGDLLRPDSAIGETELLPTLLSESLPAVEAAANLFTAPQLQELVEKGEQLLEELGENTPEGARPALDVLRRHHAG